MEVAPLRRHGAIQVGLAQRARSALVPVVEQRVVDAVDSADLEELTARLAFVDFAGDEALKASVALGLDAQLGTEFVGKHFAKVLRGIDALRNWLGG